jgi:hypothetical protein
LSPAFSAAAVLAIGQWIGLPDVIIAVAGAATFLAFIVGIVVLKPADAHSTDRELVLSSEAQDLRGQRYRPRAPDGIVELIYARPDPRPAGPTIVYKRKLRVALRNTAGSQIEVKAADWISSNGYIPFQPPFYSILQEENVARGGYLADQWNEQEVSELTVAPSAVFRASIGLDQSFSVEEINNRRPIRGVGMLALPAIIGGQEMEWRVRL